MGLVASGCGRFAFDSRTEGTSDATGSGDGQPPASCTGLMCDGFEDALPGVWTEVTGNVSIVTSPVHGGTHALRAAPLVAGDAAVTSWNHIPMQTAGDLYVRAFYYIPGPWVADHVDLAGVGPSTGGASIILQAYMNGPGAYSVPSNTVAPPTTLLLPRDQWVCLEMHALISPSAGTIEVFMAGNQVAAASGFNTQPTTGAGGYVNAAFGVEYSPPTQALPTVYVDDVVVATARIGCQ